MFLHDGNDTQDVCKFKVIPPIFHTYFIDLIHETDQISQNGLHTKLTILN